MKGLEIKIEESGLHEPEALAYTVGGGERLVTTGFGDPSSHCVIATAISIVATYRLNFALQFATSIGICSQWTVRELVVLL